MIKKLICEQTLLVSF